VREAAAALEDFVVGAVDLWEACMGFADVTPSQPAAALPDSGGAAGDPAAAGNAAAIAASQLAAAGGIAADAAGDLAAALKALDGAPSLVRACDWPGDVACLDRPGLYAWWVDDAGATALSRGLQLPLPAGRVYAGLAGATRSSGKPSSNTLGLRIGTMHFGRKVDLSTFRMTLAAVLFDELGVQVVRPKVITPASEDRLTAWMREHLSVAVHPCDNRDTLEPLERAVLRELDPPLNLRHMPPSLLRSRLTDLRRRIGRTA
jgi:hypothetical protein